MSYHAKGAGNVHLRDIPDWTPHVRTLCGMSTEYGCCDKHSPIKTTWTLLGVTCRSCLADEA